MEGNGCKLTTPPPILGHITENGGENQTRHGAKKELI
tara:strand:- start:3944 stop:4054 length:111 start_codon:yes stop_codon:yes gene_type:complete